MDIHGTSLDRTSLVNRVGSMRQVGGIQLLSYEEGHERGSRVLQFDTGTGFSFGVLVDRGMDVGECGYRGASLAWIPPKGFVAPTHFEGDEFGWLRISGLGGLFNTCGLVTIGSQQEIDVSHYQFHTRKTDFYGIHDRIGITPATRFTFGEGWEGDRYVLWAEGMVRQEIEYGENLTIRRRYETELGAVSFRMTDTVTNEGGYESPHQLLYHINIGWPVVDDGAELIASLSSSPSADMFSTGPVNADRYRRFDAPEHHATAEGYELDMATNGDGWASAAIANRSFDGGRGLGAFLRYDTSTLPTYIEWRMMSEQMYAVGMEPATNPFRPIPDLVAEGYPVMLQPGESRSYAIEIGALTTNAEIDSFASGLAGA